MKFSTVAAATTLALASTVALAGGGPLDLSSGSAGFSNTPTSLGFSDSWTFTLSTASFISGSLTSVVNGTQDVDFLAIYLTGPSGAYSWTQLLSDPFETWALANTQVAAGAYTLTLVGTNSASIGSYGGNIAVTPVPEPETYAMLLAGLGVVALISRRRMDA